MQLYSVVTNEYDADIEMLLIRRMRKHGLELAPMIVEKSDGIGSEISVGLNGENEIRLLAAALTELLLKDIRYYEMADITSLLPCPEVEKRVILRQALALTDDENSPSDKIDEMLKYLKGSKLINLEGYIHFRLRDVRESWRVAVDSAAEEVMLGEECAELTRLLGLFPGGSEERPCVRVILNPDGSCTLTEGPECEAEAEFRIDCAPGSTSGIMGMILGMRPKKVLLCDLSFGKCDELRGAIEMLYGAINDSKKE